MESVFSDIYENFGFYGSHESRSGGGSTLHSTEMIREEITKLVIDRGIKSVVDFPCGDFNWMKEIVDNFEEYTGCDIVPKCIDDNRSKYPNYNFKCLNLIKDTIPLGDLLIVRDVIGHQPLKTGLQMIENILSSNCKYLLSTTWAKKTDTGDYVPCQPGEVESENEGCAYGRFYPVNLMGNPFNFPEPELYIEERTDVVGYDNGMRKTLALWDISKIKEYRKQPMINETHPIVSDDMNLTIVSGLWNIDRVGRDFSKYEEHFDKFLKIPCNMILFVPKELEEFVKERRSIENTLIRIYELEDIKDIMFQPFWDRWSNIRNSPDWQQQAGWLGESPQCKNEYYNPIVMSKMFFLHDGKILNPFNTDYFVWLDAGITQTVYENYFYSEDNLKRLTDYLDPFLFLSYPYEANNEIHGFDFEKMNSYAKKKVEYVCRGGLFGGHKDFLSEANDQYYQLLNKTLNSQVAGTEECIFTLLSYLHGNNYRRYALDENGLIIKFIQALDSNEVTLEERTGNPAQVRKLISTDIQNIKTNLYFLTFNYPEQLEYTIESLNKHPGFLDHPYQKIIIDNSTDEEAREGNAKLCEKYGFEHIIRDENTGICGGRQFAAEHFHETDAEYYLFFEDDMTLASESEEGQYCRNGFRKYIPDLYLKLHQIMIKEEFDYLKLSFTEVYMDNNIQTSWYNVPQHFRDTEWPDYNQLPETGLDPYSPRTKFDRIDRLEDGLTYITGDVYYANWPMICSKAGNKKIFIDTKWQHPYEQTWMSHVYQETRKGNISPAVLLASPVNHERFKHYHAEDRREN